VRAALPQPAVVRNSEIVASRSARFSMLAR
jgi:hypothetical protein